MSLEIEAYGITGKAMMHLYRCLCCVHAYEAAHLGEGEPPLPFPPVTHLSEGEPLLGRLFQQPGQQRLQRLHKRERLFGVISAGGGVITRSS